MKRESATRTGILLGGALSILVLSLTTLVGCTNDDLTTAPTTLLAPAGDVAGPELAGTSELKAKSRKGDEVGTETTRVVAPDGDPVGQDVATRSGTIGASSGGVLVNGRVSLSFPPGALDTDTEITVLVSPDHVTGKKVDFELLPHGLTFNVPVTLTVDMGGTGLTAADDVRQYWWDESASTWVDIGGTWNGSTVTTPLEHFSVYKTGRVGW